MAKRERIEVPQILIQGFGSNVKSDDILNIFCKFGKIEFVRFLCRRQCLLQFEHPDSIPKALQLNNTKQPSLSALTLTVSIPEFSDKPVKKSHSSLGSFIALDPPRFNNYLIPTLPSFFTS